ASSSVFSWISWAKALGSAQAIQEKTDDEAAQVEKFLQKSQELYGITSHVFLERSLHQLSTYLQKDTLKSMLKLHKLDAFRSMNRANKGYFSDPRVVQLFNRYATYNGSNPYVAPATLNIIAHLEHNLGAFFPKKGMYQISESLYELAVELGVSFHFGQKVDEITVSEKSVTGIRIGEIPIAADLVVSNADVVPTYRHLLASEKAPERTLTQPRSSSALIFYWGMEALFPELDLHNIFFSQDYSGEFETMWEEAGISDDPTVYLYISSKQVPDDAPAGKENWFVMINVPPQNGQNWDALVAQARKHIIAKLSRMLGRDIESLISSESVLDPRRIEAETSSYQGALYGNSSNNRFAAFLRHPNFSPRIKGLYFCGGSVHPGGGIPLCLLSARIVSDLIEKRHT
ncbi:MAG: 1-hydroxycarotenoid 3,4-desaturase CrtD, partial [Bacteroidota bacterium]